jgi:hypothetical protein
LLHSILPAKNTATRKTNGFKRITSRKNTVHPKAIFAWGLTEEGRRRSINLLIPTNKKISVRVATVDTTRKPISAISIAIAQVGNLPL